MQMNHEINKPVSSQKRKKRIEFVQTLTEETAQVTQNHLQTAI